MYINRIGAVGGVSMVDAQVAASADDGGWNSSISYFSNKLTQIDYGSDGTCHMFARWTGISIPAGATIKNSYVQVYVDRAAAVVGRLYMNDAATPTAPTTYATADAKVTTSAYVSWTIPAKIGWAQSGDISAVIQELVNSYGAFSNGAMMMLLLSDLSDPDYTAIRAYDYTGNLHGARLHIEW